MLLPPDNLDASSNNKTKMATRANRADSDNGGLARLTCEPCRDRKVRCNREYPECSRCARLGTRCSYRERVSQRSNQAAMIYELQERVSQAEARLASQASAPFAINTDAVPMSESSLQTPTKATAQPSTPPTTIHVSPAQEYLGDYLLNGSMKDSQMTGFDFAALDVEMFGHDFYQLDQMQCQPQQQIEKGYSMPASPAQEAGPAKDLSEALSLLHEIFFERYSTVMPILIRGHFYQNLQEFPDSTSVQAVSYTIALLAITISEPHKHLEGACYTLAKRFSEECESNDVSGAFQSIGFLHALLFLTRYEIGKRRSVRAWLTLGRATCLARMMRLDQIDHIGGSSMVDPNLPHRPHVPLHETFDLLELEERRRCFWYLYILEGYGSIHSGTLGLLDDNKLLVCIPSPGILDADFEPSPMPYITEAATICNPYLLSSFSNAVLVVSLIRKILDHVNQTAKRVEYSASDFWDRHYTLVRLLNTHEALLQPLYLDALAFDTHLTFCGIKLRLYQAATEHSEKQGVSAVVNSENENQLSATALKVATTIRTSWTRHRFACDDLSLSGAFIAWPLTLTIKALKRNVLNTPESSQANVIQMLHESLDDIEAPGGPWHNKESILVINGSDINTTFSHEIGGVVERVGSSVSKVAVGDLVVGFGFGGFGSHQVTSEKMLQKVRKGESLDEMTGLPLAYVSALYGLKHLAGVKSGDVVLVLGGTGLSGAAAIEVSISSGATPYVVTSTEEETAFITKKYSLSREQVLANQEKFSSYARRAATAMSISFSARVGPQSQCPENLGVPLHPSVSSLTLRAVTGGSGDAGASMLASVLEAASPAEAAQVARDHVVGKLSRMLLLDLEVFDGDAGSVASYGIDSMIGADLRNWIFKEFAMDIPFQQLLAPTLNVMKLGQKICAPHGIGSEE